MRKRKVFALVALAAIVAMFVAACGSDSSSSDTTSTAPSGPTIKLRGQAFSESQTITEVYGQYLQSKGYDVNILTAAGFRTEAIDGLKNGDLDMVIDYIGGDQAALAPEDAPSGDPAKVSATITPLFAKIGVTVLPYSQATDGDAFVVRGDSTATNISDVKGLDYSFGASSQCFTRPQCYLGLTSPKIYDITFKSKKTIEFGPLLGEALKAKQVDSVVWNTTAPQIMADGFKVLTDDKGLFPAQNIAPLINTKVLDAYGPQLATDINALSAKITTDDLLAWNTSTDIDKQEPADVASAWLKTAGL